MIITTTGAFNLWFTIMFNDCKNKDHKTSDINRTKHLPAKCEVMHCILCDVCFVKSRWSKSLNTEERNSVSTELTVFSDIMERLLNC